MTRRQSFANLEVNSCNQAGRGGEVGDIVGDAALRTTAAILVPLMLRTRVVTALVTATMMLRATLKTLLKMRVMGLLRVMLRIMTML